MNSLMILENASQITVRLDVQAVALKEKLLAEAATLTAVGDDESQAIAVGIMRSLKSLTNGVEDTRTQIKAPVLAAGKQIDTLAKTFCKELLGEYERVQALASAWEAIKCKKREDEEAERQAAIEKAAAERRAAELAERKRIEAIEAERLAEVRRIEEEARKAKAEAERAVAAARSKKAREEAEKALKAQEDAARLARMDAELAAADAKKLADADALARATADLEAAAKQASLPAVLPAKVEGSISTTRWKFEVLDIAALYAARPDLVELTPRTREINDILGAFAEKGIPGLRIFRETKVGVRT